MVRIDHIRTIAPGRVGQLADEVRVGTGKAGTSIENRTLSTFADAGESSGRLFVSGGTSSDGAQNDDRGSWFVVFR